jgi:putative hemolysin
MIIAVILISLLLSAFFSGMEIAFVSANRLQIAIKTNQSNGVVSKILAHFANKPGWFISAMLIGNNATVVVYSLYLAQLVDPVLAQWFDSEVLIVVFQTIFATIILLIFAEFLPKTIFRINPNNTLTVLAIPVFVIYLLLFLPSIIIISITELVMLLLIKKENRTEEKVVFEKTDLDAYLSQTLRENAQGDNQDYEVKLFHKALSFSEVIARDCMIPRNEIIAIEIKESVAALKKKFIETEVSKILVFKDTIDNIIGYVHSFEMFKNPENIKNILWPVSVIPETMSANKILQELLKKNRSMAIVLDEYGGTAGLVTMEDIIEEIFGEIDDEHDTEEKESIQLSDNEFRFSARLEIDYINEKYNLNIPVSEEYETLGGFLISRFRDIPEKGAQLDFDNYHFVIEEVGATKIQTVYLNICKD